MNKTSSMKEHQHVVPRTYLKHWKISQNENFVYGIDLEYKYVKSAQKFGLDHKVFTRKRYYNHPQFKNPYQLEDVLGTDVEPDYSLIMKEINSESDLTFDTRTLLIRWLYYSKMRSPYIRDNTQRLVQSSLEFQEMFKAKSRKLTAEKIVEIEKVANDIAKATHLNTMSSQAEQLVELFVSNALPKHWSICKAAPELEFWTNDNPGFSPNQHPKFSKDIPYHKITEMNPGSVVMFPLSPKYCLLIQPFNKDYPPEVNAMNMKIEYKQISLPLTMHINNGVFHTANRVLVSNKAENLNKYIVAINLVK